MCSNQIKLFFLLHNTPCVIINLGLGEKSVVESVSELLIKMLVLTISKRRESHAEILNSMTMGDYLTLFFPLHGCRLKLSIKTQERFIFLPGSI